MLRGNFRYNKKQFIFLATDSFTLITMALLLQEWGPFPITIFAPVAEPADAPSPFITRSPVEAYAADDVAQVPWIATLTENEGLYPLLSNSA